MAAGEVLAETGDGLHRGHRPARHGAVPDGAWQSPVGGRGSAGRSVRVLP